MIHHYLAATGISGLAPAIPPELDRELGRRGLGPRWRSPALVLYATDDLPLRFLPGDRGIVVGRLFDGGAEAAPDRVPRTLSHEDCDRFVVQLWGSYVAIEAANGELRVLRDPMGSLGCYHAEAGGLHYVTSVPHLLIDCGLIAGELDWSVIAGALTDRRARTSATALRDVEELPAGALLTVGRQSRAAVQVWDPARLALGGRRGRPAADLAQALDSSLTAWASCAARPLVEVSGGLDSAIVAAGIAAVSPRASLITFSAAPGDPDETAYARALARHLALPLAIAAPRIEDVDLARSAAADLPRPNARSFTQATDALSADHGRKIAADAFVSGGGGDDVFCYQRSVLPAIDRFHADGWRAALTTAYDIAVMNHSTLWQALHRIVRRLLAGGAGGARPDTRFLSSAVAAPADRAEPERRALLPGKADHVRGIVSIRNYLEGHGRSELAPVISPLLSQPVVECCLAIPSWAWCEGGRNRAVARAAFADRLPRMLVERRSKGAFDGFCARLLASQRRRAREILLDGTLAREGLIDRSAVAAALADPFPRAEIVTRLLWLVDVEAWLGSWTGRQRPWAWRRARARQR